MPRKTKKQTGRSEWMKKYNATRGNKEQKRLEEERNEDAKNENVIKSYVKKLEKSKP
eukprot:gene9756-2083_t